MTSLHTASVVRLAAREFSASVLALKPSTAVFDCDGTLWSGDAGYEFMLWSIEEGLLSRAACDWLDSRYRLYRAGEVGEAEMCGEMVQVYAGLREEEIRKASARFFEERIASGIFPEMLELAAALRAQGAELWAVSSTCNWVIEEGVRGFGIPPERVRAVTVASDGGVVTSRLLDIPTDEAKAASLARAGVPHPDAVFGNSIHDAAMLAIARRAFPVNPTPALLSIASQNGWPVFYPESVSPERK